MKTPDNVGNSVCAGRDGGFVAGDLVYPRRLRVPRPMTAHGRQERVSTARAGNVAGFWAKRRLSNKAPSTWRLGSLGAQVVFVVLEMRTLEHAKFILEHAEVESLSRTNLLVKQPLLRYVR